MSLTKTLAKFADLDDLDHDGPPGEDDDEGLALGGITELVEIGPDRLDGVLGPANGIPALILKQAGRKPRKVRARLLKTVTEARFGLYCAYPSGRVDRAVAADGFRDFAGPEAVEAGAWSFLEKGGSVGLGHMPGTEGAGRVVESWIHRAAPWTLTAADGSAQTVHPGDWCVGVIWSQKAWDMIKSGRINGISMQGTAKRRRPSARSLAAVRKGTGDVKMAKALRKAVRAAMADATAGTAAQAAAMGSRLEALESARGLRCGKCSKKAKPGSAYCVKCGAGLGGVAKAAAGTAADARTLRTVIAKAGRNDPAALALLLRTFGPVATGRLVDGSATLREVGGSVAKAVAALSGGSAPGEPCRTCGGRKRLRHPGTGANSRVCPSCHGTGEWAPGGEEADMTPEDGSLVTQYAEAAKAGSPDGMGRLMAMVGPQVAATIVSGGDLSASEFRSGYLSACRASRSAAPGQEPRIPRPAVIRPDDFRRGPLGPGQARPAPASTWAGMGGQADYYGSSGGIGTDVVAAERGARGPASAFVTPGLAASQRTAG